MICLEELTRPFPDVLTFFIECHPKCRRKVVEVAKSEKKEKKVKKDA